MNKEYYICSERVIELLKPSEFSKPIITYPDCEYLKDIVYVAVLDFAEVERVYNSFEEDSEDQSKYWAQQIVPGQMRVDSIKMKDFKKSCPWSVIEERLDLTKMNNRAMTLCNLADREGLNPIEFWNKIA